MQEPNPGLARRSFLQAACRTVAAVGVFGFLLGAYAKRSTAWPATALRPPGALAEQDFLGACVRCGLCVRACPYATLDLAQPGTLPPAGTPYFIARRIPCEMCEDLPCVKACPTGALDPRLTDIKRADMGLAVFSGPGSCYAMSGMSCRACYMACPVRDQAISMHMIVRDHSTVFMPAVTAAYCTGCGKCEAACLTPQASIKVLPRTLLRSDPGYRIEGA